VGGSPLVSAECNTQNVNYHNHYYLKTEFLAFKLHAEASQLIVFHLNLYFHLTITTLGEMIVGSIFGKTRVGDGSLLQERACTFHYPFPTVWIKSIWNLGSHTDMW
jgi:hypothetical protein